MPEGTTMITYPVDYRYTKDHSWVELAGDYSKVGVTFHAVSQVGDVVYVDLPQTGVRLKQGQLFGTIESTDAFLELYSPLSGEIVMVNTVLTKSPETANADPHGNWFIVLRHSETADSEALLDASQYTRLIETRLMPD
jgi:glycine cleavage system H protein